MEDVLLGYEVNGATWFYLSLLLIFAVFFRFNRVWSLRNADLILLLSLSPGLLLIGASGPDSPLGYLWLFAVTGVLWLRMLTDVMFTRRPRLEQNLNPAGLAFLLCSALAFQTTKIVMEEPHAATVHTVRQADDLLNRTDTPVAATVGTPAAGPAGRLLATPVVPLSGGVETIAARCLAVACHLAVMFGLVLIGRWHFADTNLGLAMATLYLLLPCTSYDASRVTHVLPGALIVWAVVAYRRPLWSGTLLGLACGTMFFAVFLLPIWMSFYWKRGAWRFAGALGTVACVLLASLLLTSADSHSFTRQILGSIDWSVLKFDAGYGVGLWSIYDPAYRIPVFTLFGVVLVTLTIWPLEKNLEHLLAHSASTIVATQFWYPHEGGIFVLWYLPLALVVAFRPRLAHLRLDDDRIASTTANVLVSPSRASPDRDPQRSTHWKAP
ncbi:MAG TPA: hypothetical protein VM165_06800 [Planctomycetaceae bacterium]|nr:hypothetical protein [Planctomycetaceae bacterium]